MRARAEGLDQRSRGSGQERRDDARSSRRLRAVRRSPGAAGGGMRFTQTVARPVWPGAGNRGTCCGRRETARRRGPGSREGSSTTASGCGTQLRDVDQRAANADSPQARGGESRKISWHRAGVAPCSATTLLAGEHCPRPGSIANRSRWRRATLNRDTRKQSGASQSGRGRADKYVRWL